MTVQTDSPQARRRAKVAERLRDALAQLAADPRATVTPSALAKLAGISRNTLYANHRSMLDAVRSTAQTRQGDALSEPATLKAPTQRHLEEQMRQLATQNAGLLQRALTAERRSAQLETRNAELIRALDALCKPALVAKDAS